MKYIPIFILILSILNCSMPEKYSTAPETKSDICGIALLPKNISLIEQNSCTVSLLFLNADGTRHEISSNDYTLQADSEYLSCNKNTLTALHEGDTTVTVHYLDFTDSLAVHILSRPDYSHLLISEIMYDPSGTEPDGEYIEIYNNSAKRCSLNGVSLIDGNTSSTPFLFTDISIEPYSYVVIAQSAAAFVSAYAVQPDIWPLGFSLNNAGESIFLKDPSGNILDAVYIKNGTAEFPATAPWGSLSSAEGKSLHRKAPIRDTDTPDDFEAGDPTPGW
jgi:hypothetical protein